MASKFTITAELNLQTKNLNQVVNNLRQQFQGTNLNIKIKDLAKTESQLRGVASSASEASKESKLLGNSLNQAFKRFTVITAVTGTLVGFTRSLKKGVSQAIEFEREIVKIAQATGKTVSQLRGLVSEINKVSTAFGVSSQELTLASRTLTQAGFAADKVAGALKVLAQTELAATFDSIQDTTEGAIALLNQFGREAQRTGNEVKFLEQSFSAINQVSKEFAVESSDIVTAIRTTGSAFESAGGSLNELIALFTSVRSTTRESAESIATGFRTIFTRVQRVDTINALRDLGIELQDAEGKFVGPIEAAKRLSVALQTIDPKDFRFNLVVEELGGFRQVSKVIPLIQQFAVTQKALNVAQGASGSLAKDAETAQQSLAVQIAKTREEFSRLIREIVDTSTFQSTIKAILGLANAFIQVADTVKPLIPLIAGFAAIKIGNALGVGLRSFASKGATGRDVPIGFATGGLVPGSGNGDTVPAMLTPGEFVIRKSSVNKLGADNLARVNKYGIGGKAKADKQKKDQLEPVMIKNEWGEQDTKFISAIGGLPAGTEIVNSSGDSIGIKNDKFSAQVDALSLYIPSEEREKLEGGGAGWEKYIAEKLGYKPLNIADNKFPFDLISKDGKTLIDAKDYSATKLTTADGLHKGINYLLYKSLEGKLKSGQHYSYANLSSQRLNLDRGNSVNIGNTPLTKGTDDIKSPFDIQLIVPRSRRKNLGGIIQKFEKGGRAEAFRGARAITIPEPETYTYNKPAGIDLDSLTGDSKNYKVNAGDRLEYNRINHNIDLDKENVSPGLFGEYKAETDPAKRGKIFEKILLSLGKVQSLSKMQNARLDAISASGNPSEIKSRKEAMNIKELEEKLWGAIVSNADGSLAEMMTRQRMNSNRWTEGEDFFNIGDIDVFEDITGGLGKEINAKEVRTRQEVQAAQSAKELSKNAIADARAKLQAAVIAVVGDSNNLYNLKGKVLSPLSGKGEIYSDTVTAVRETLNIDKVADLWPAIAQMQPSEIQKAVRNSIQRKAAGGFIEKFANGGFSSGTDTVPAMLTPGEFVVNKKSAQKIGYASLNRMNKVGKYASGGAVQYFASGTSGTGAQPTSGSSGIGDVLNQADRFIKTWTTVGYSLKQQTVLSEQLQLALRKWHNAGKDAAEVMNAIEQGAVKLGAGFEATAKGIAAAYSAGTGFTPSTKPFVGPQKPVNMGGMDSRDIQLQKALDVVSKKGGDTAKSMKYLSDTFNLLGPEVFDNTQKFKQLTKEMINVGTGVSRSGALLTEAKIAKAGGGSTKSTKSEPNLKDVLDKMSEGSSKSATNLLLMAGVIESVVVQFSGLSEELKAGASAFGATLSTYLAIGSQLKEFGVAIGLSILKKKEEQLAGTKQTLSAQANTTAFNQDTAAILMNAKARQVSDTQEIAQETTQKLLVSEGKNGEKGKGKGKGKDIGMIMDTLQGAFVGFSVSMAVANGAAAYFAEVAQASAKKMEDAMTKFKENISSTGKEALSNAVNTAFQDAGRSNIVGGGLTSAGGLAAAGAGALGGAAIGASAGAALGPLGAVIGGVIGGLTGLGIAFISFQADYEKVQKSIKNSAEALTSSFYTSAKETKKLQDFLQNIDKKGDADISKQITESASKYQSSLATLTIAQKEAVNSFGSLDKAPDAMKDAFNKAEESARSLRIEFDKVTAAQTSRKLKEIGSKLGTQGFSSSREINKFAESRRKDMSGMVQQELNLKYSAPIQQLENSGYEKEAQNVKNALQSLSKIKVQESILTLKRDAAEAAIQITNQKIATEKELKAREAVIGSLNRQLALTSAFENFRFAMEKNSKSLTAIDAVMNGTVSGLQSFAADVSVLDLSAPIGKNLTEFEKAMDQISSIGPAGQDIATNLKDLQTVVPNLETQLNSIDLSSFGDPTTSGKAIEDLIGNLGIDKGGAVAGALKKSFSAAFSSREMTTREGVGDPQKQIETILTTFKEFGDNLKARGKEVLEAYNTFENANRAIYDRMLEVQQKELDLRLKGIDGQRTLVENIAKARGKDVSLAEKDQFRVNMQTAALSTTGIATDVNLAGNAQALGRELLNVKKQLMDEENIKKIGVRGQAELQSRAKGLSEALRQLEDQSGRTADIMSEIDKIRAQRETITGAATKYAFSSDEERAKTDEVMQAAQSAFSAGSLEAVPSEMRSEVLNLLNEFKDIEFMGGMKGGDIAKELSARFYESQGNFQVAKGIREQSSTPEEKLIQELQNTAASEKASREALLQQQSLLQEKNNQALDKNTAALQESLVSIATRERQLGGVAAQGMQTFGSRPDITALETEKKSLETYKTNIDNQLKETSQRANQLGEIIDKATNTYMTALNNWNNSFLGIANNFAKKVATFSLNTINAAGEVAKNAANVPKAAIRTAVGGVAQGGLIPNDLVYRAGGGSIFQPRGTDTVPAMLTPGEFVMSKGAVSKHGVGFMQSLNSGGSVGYYANGGLVGEQFTQFMNQFQEMAQVMSGMTMTHKITVDGQLNIGGINGEQIATQIRDAIGNYVGEIVSKKINDFKGRAG